MPLTDSQKKAAEEYIMNGKTKVDAYKAAYDVPSGLTAKQIADRADKVFSGKAINEEIARLQSICSELEVISKKELLTDLVDVYKVAKENSYQVVEAPDGSMIKVLVPKAADVFAKLADKIALMIGANAPEKVENVVNFEFDEEFDKYAN
jgi:hypothetical protein